MVITALLATTFLVKACGFAYDFLGYSISAAHGTTAAGAALTLFGVGWCVGQLASGAMTDRLGARSACTIGLLLAAAVCAGLTVASGLNTLMLLAFCLGCTMDVHRPAVSAQINERLTNDGARTRAQGWVYWVSNVGISLSGGVGGFVAQAHGYRFLFALNAVASVAAALLVRRTLTGRRAAPRAEQAHVTYAQIISDARLRWMVAAAIAATTCAYGLISVLPLVMSADGLAPSAYGTAMLANSAAVLLLSPPLTRLLVGRDDRVRYPIGPVLAAGSLILGAAMALAALQHTIVGYATAAVLMVPGEICYSVAAGAFVATAAPAGAIGRYQAALSVAGAIASLTPLAVAGALTAGGRPLVAGLLVASAVLGALACVPLSRTLRTADTADTAEPAGHRPVPY
ncbi:MFS transporter [Streptomyces spectabilis]|uniref:Na+/melibiose symporter-like transporter n=1 Tax=Streptomyces spectabilis TaxID=68270 RepID=A0A7W8APB2_STRST|nr:MFS transporter [Streptomyces spectabilis]MBB5101541.1 Na+/melibiose symporter-like transporter [Streptomyces spectabilis]MCI3900728.1 MFS transporter [Streptomyces spectabilis]